MSAAGDADRLEAEGAESREVRLAEIAERLGCELRGDGDLLLSGIRTLEAAGPRDLSFLVSAEHRTSYREAARRSRAAALLVSPDDADELGDQHALLIIEDPGLALIRVVKIFHPPVRPAAGIHPTAVTEGAEVDPSAHIGPYAVIGAGSQVDANAVIDAHVSIGRSCRIGAGARIHPHAVLYDQTEIGERSIVHAGVVLGADGFGYTTRGGVHHKVPQVGRTSIGADVEIGALSAVDRATLEETRIGAGSKIDNLVQVGHNVTTGRGCILCGQVGLAGSARLGDYVVMGGQSGAAGHLSLEDGVQVAARGAVFESAPAGRQLGGTPAIDLRRWRRQIARLGRLGDWAKRLRALEKKLEL